MVLSEVTKLGDMLRNHVPCVCVCVPEGIVRVWLWCQVGMDCVVVAVE